MKNWYIDGVLNVHEKQLQNELESNNETKTSGSEFGIYEVYYDEMV